MSARTATALLMACDEARRARDWPRLRITTSGDKISVSTSIEFVAECSAPTIEEACERLLALMEERYPLPECSICRRRHGSEVQHACE